MDGQFATPSFIPKKPLVTRSGSTVNFGGLFLFLSIAIFILSIGGYGAVYFYDVTIKNSIVSLDTQIAKQKTIVTPDDVNNLFNFDQRVRTAKDLLYLDTLNNPSDTTQHITLIPLLGLLGQSTLKTVRFSDFKYSDIDNKKIEIRMSGEAMGYPSIALQATAFEATKEFQNIVFSDLNLGANQRVTFNLVMNVKPELVSYANMLKSEQ